MYIKFEGYYKIPDKEVPDDRGTVDNWLVQHIASVIERGPELEDIYANLKLNWQVVED